MSIKPSGVSLVIGVTAHRRIAPEQEPRIVELLDGFFERLQARFPHLPLLLLNPLAEGGDRLVARVARRHGIPLCVPLPFNRLIYEETFHEPGSLDEFRGLMDGAMVRQLPLAVGIHEADLLQAGHARDRQYAQLGMYISSHCQVLLALWDGEHSDAEGGTAQVVHFHLDNMMTGVAAQDIAPNLLADDDSDLVHHIRCARRRSPAAHEAPTACWLTIAGEHPGDGPPPDDHVSALRQMEQFNEDVARHRDAIAATPERLLTEPPVAPPLYSLHTEDLFATADWLAIHFQRLRRRTLLLTHLTAMLMGLAFILYSDLEARPVFVASFLLFFGLGVVLGLIARRKQWHRKYLDYRGLAEGLRVQLYWDLAHVMVPANSSFGYDSFLQKQDVELSWIRHAMRYADLWLDALHIPDPHWLDWVLRHWIGDADGHGGQLEYFRNATAARLHHHRGTQRLGQAALVSGIAGAVILLVAGTRIQGSAQNLLILAMGLLPLLAGIREAYSYKKADKELIKQFGFMTRLFESCRARLSQAKDVEETRDLLLALGRACVDEHAEWILLHRERPLEHETPA